MIDTEFLITFKSLAEVLELVIAHEDVRMLDIPAPPAEATDPTARPQRDYRDTLKSAA